MDGEMIAWDSCVFLAWFKQEKDKPLGEIERILNDIANGKQKLIVSVICCTEVLDEAGATDAGSQFKGFIKRKNVIPANVDFRVAELAATFRERVTAEVKAGRMTHGLKAPDALIAASAVIYRASILHSFDPVLRRLSGTSFINELVVDIPGSDNPQKLLDWE